MGPRRLVPPNGSPSSKGGARDRWGWHSQLWHELWLHFFWPTFWLHCILYRTGVPIWGAKPPRYVKYKIQCSQKVGQKKWSHNLCQSWLGQPPLASIPPIQLSQVRPNG